MAYQVAHVDELEKLPIDDEGLTWRPVRRRFGIEAFGVNAYTAERAGQRVVEEHYERDGHDELYFVASGHATFTLGDDEVDAPAGTFVYVEPGTRRGAVARDDGTTIVAMGAKRGEVFSPSGWEWTFVASSYQRLGRDDDAIRVMREGVERYPDDWQAYYNLACIEAKLGRHAEALGSLQRAAAIAPEEVATYAATDSDLDPIRDDPSFPRGE